MKQYSCVIIEDEPLAAERTRSYVERIPFLKLGAVFDNALNGLTYLKQNTVDLLLLDIKMDELSGIELLESVHLTTQVIITTAYQEYAVKGYELRIADYLLKPFTFSRFLQAVARAQENIHRKPHVLQDFIFIKTECRLEKIMLGDILYIEGMRDYRRIHTMEKKIMTLQNFSDLEVQIPSSIICRVHKSYMVALNKIDSIERGRIKIAGQLIPISETYKDLLWQMINSRA